MKITIGHVIAYALDAQFGFEREYPGPHRDVGKNIITINKVLTEFGAGMSLHRTLKAEQFVEVGVEVDIDGHPATSGQYEQRSEVHEMSLEKSDSET